jgi:excisionase family DNA binding protein
MGVSRSRVYALIKAGELPAYKDGARTLILVADIEAWLARLRAMPKSGPSTGPLLPHKARKLARQKVVDSTEPLLPIEEQQIAIERASEPVQPAVEPDPLAPTDLPQPAPEPDFRRLYFERLNPDAGEEGKRWAFEFVVNAYRRFHNCSLEDAKRAVLALLKP